jgi:hypothetical protein
MVILLVSFVISFLKKGWKNEVGYPFIHAANLREYLDFYKFS